MEKKKSDMPIKKHMVVNIFCIIVFIISLLSLVVSIMKQSSIIGLLSSLIITLFTIVFTITSITYKRSSKSLVLVGCLLLTTYFGLNIINCDFISSNGIPNFTGKSVTDVISWASKNSITINQEYEYSDMIPEYRIISQNIESGTNMNKVKELTISISEGANPSKEIVVPSMIGWDCERVLKFIKNNYLSNVEVEFIQSDMAKDTVINQSASGNLKRDDLIKLTFSYGEELDSNEVSLIDFTNMSKFEVEFYMKQHQLKYKFEDAFSNKIKRGYAVKQSVDAGNKVSVNDSEIVVTISKGPEIEVPDLLKYSMSEITEWAIKNKVKLNFSDSYDDSVKKNAIISTNVNKGDIIEQGTTIKVVLSRGSLKMPTFKSIEDFYDWANKYNIKYEEQHEFSDTVEAGKVISYSYKNGSVIKNGDSIIVKISDGVKRGVPNVVGLTKSNAISKLENASLKYSVVYKNSTSTKDKVLSQSISAGSEVSSGTTVVITVSNGKAPSNPSQQQQPPQQQQQQRQDPPAPPTPQCNSCTVTGLKNIIRDNLNGGYGSVSSALRSYIQGQCPGITVQISSDSTSGKASGSFISGFQGGNTTSCQTVSIVLAN